MTFQLIRTHVIICLGLKHTFSNLGITLLGTYFVLTFETAIAFQSGQQQETTTNRGKLLGYKNKGAAEQK